MTPTSADSLSIGQSGTYSDEVSIKTQIFKFRKMYLKILFAKLQPFYQGVHMLSMLLRMETQHLALHSHIVLHWNSCGEITIFAVRETNTRPLANASAFWAGQVENCPGRVKFCIEHIRGICFGRVLQKLSFPHCNWNKNKRFMHHFADGQVAK